MSIHHRRLRPAVAPEIADTQEVLAPDAPEQVPDWYRGSVFEAVDTMSQRELDHLKGRECEPEEHCRRCDALRARYDRHSDHAAGETP